MSDYRRIDPEALVTQARALDQLSAELELSALRVNATLAGVGLSAPTGTLTETAQWMQGWSGTMTQKAAIAAQAVSMPYEGARVRSRRAT